MSNPHIIADKAILQRNYRQCHCIEMLLLAHGYQAIVKKVRAKYPNFGKSKGHEHNMLGDKYALEIAQEENPMLGDLINQIIKLPQTLRQARPNNPHKESMEPKPTTSQPQPQDSQPAKTIAASTPQRLIPAVVPPRQKFPNGDVSHLPVEGAKFFRLRKRAVTVGKKVVQKPDGQFEYELTKISGNFATAVATDGRRITFHVSNWTAVQAI